MGLTKCVRLRLWFTKPTLIIMFPVFKIVELEYKTLDVYFEELNNKSV